MVKPAFVPWNFNEAPLEVVAEKAGLHCIVTTTNLLLISHQRLSNQNPNFPNFNICIEALHMCPRMPAVLYNLNLPF